MKGHSHATNVHRQLVGRAPSIYQRTDVRFELQTKGRPIAC
jgi:hypothetical protein